MLPDQRPTTWTFHTAWSGDIKVIGGPTLETFAGPSYDAIDRTKASVVLAKASLLNLHSKLTAFTDPVGNGKRWFGYLRRILKMGRERAIAVVDPAMASHVKKINREPGRFDNYRHTPARNHHDNFPGAFDVGTSAEELFSIKSSDPLANVQLTLGRGTEPGTNRRVWLLDTDIDERGTFWGHLGDLIKHKFTGGTHPYDIHEFLLLIKPARDLGYQLRRKPST